MVGGRQPACLSCGAGLGVLEGGDRVGIPGAERDFVLYDNVCGE